jgi:hypothetical protein
MKTLSKRRSTRRLIVTAAVIAVVGSDAWAHRPFDGTDADVVESGVFELEAGVGRTHGGGADGMAIPSVVFSYGLSDGTEMSLDAQIEHASRAVAGEPRNSLDDTSLSIKHVFVRGSLQDGTGPSVATECSVLLPEIHGSSGTGGECAVIVSNKWDAMTLHLNLGLGRSRERDVTRTVDLIAEGPGKWLVRPMAEVLAERDHGNGRVSSGLVGAVYQHSEDLAIDFGVRRARTNDGTFNEVRLGLTWSFPVAK